jgi:hypothetical protein
VKDAEDEPPHNNRKAATTKQNGSTNVHPSVPADRKKQHQQLPKSIKEKAKSTDSGYREQKHLQSS